MNTTKRFGILVIADGAAVRRVPIGLIDENSRFIDLVYEDRAPGTEPLPPNPPTPESMEWTTPRSRSNPSPWATIGWIGVGLLTYHALGAWGMIILGAVLCALTALGRAGWREARRRSGR